MKQPNPQSPFSADGRFAPVVGRFAPITLDGMDAIRLMNRIDTKYLTDSATLEKLLEAAASLGYRVLETDGGRIQHYRSMYYDTPGLQMYLDHHNRRLTRQKLRIRSYDGFLTFLELKKKNNHGRTKKKRMEIPVERYGQPVLDAGARAWLDGRLKYPAALLRPALETVFSRITLVDAQMTERSTIDFSLRFQNLRNGRSADLGALAVIEVKQDGQRPSPLRDLLLHLRVKPFRISKYCIGTALTDTEIRAGRFKQKLILIEKLKSQI